MRGRAGWKSDLKVGGYMKDAAGEQGSSIQCIMFEGGPLRLPRSTPETRARKERVGEWLVPQPATANWGTFDASGSQLPQKWCGIPLRSALSGSACIWYALCCPQALDRAPRAGGCPMTMHASCTARLGSGASMRPRRARSSRIMSRLPPASRPSDDSTIPE